MCDSARWKREIVPNHKVSTIILCVSTAVDDHLHSLISSTHMNPQTMNSSCVWSKLSYLIILSIIIYTLARYLLWLYIIVFKFFLVYVSNIFSTITMLTTSNWSNKIFAQCQTTNGSSCIHIPFHPFAALAHSSNALNLTSSPLTLPTPFKSGVNWLTVDVSSCPFISRAATKLKTLAMAFHWLHYLLLTVLFPHHVHQRSLYSFQTSGADSHSCTTTFCYKEHQFSDCV